MLITIWSKHTPYVGNFVAVNTFLIRWF